MTEPITTTRRRHYDSKGGGYESGRYSEQHMEGYRAFRNETLFNILSHRFQDKPLRVLEVGCGTGLTLEYMARSARHYSLFGLDASETMLRQAASKASTLEKPPHLVLGDAGRLPYPSESFDAVFATRFIHQFPHEAKRHLWREFSRVVRSGGLVVVEFYARPYHWVRFYFGGRKGRGRQAYFDHYPSRAEVENIVGGSPEVHALRVPGSRLLAATLGDEFVRHATGWAGQAFNGAFLDEYFVVSRKP